jgi:hypothetical protein
LQPRSAVFHRSFRALVPAITSVVFLLAGSLSHAAPICGRPASSGSAPTASDALFVLRTTVALEQCDACVCDVDGDGTTTTSDALMLLRASAGSEIALACAPCVDQSAGDECPGIAQFTLLAGTRTPCASNADCGGLGVCNPAIGRCVTQTRLENGWTGLAHHDDANDIVPARLILDCQSDAAPCGECGIVGLDPALLNCRCANDHREICFHPFDNDTDVCGGNACECFFGPPLPLVTGNNPTCLLNQVTSVGGTANVDAGSGRIDFALTEFVHLGVTLLAPCPYCDADSTPGDGVREGTCVGGVDAGLDCDAESGNATFPAPGGGRASLDCLPETASNISGSGLKIDVVLSTGASSITATIPCSAGDPQGEKCPCGVCSLDQQIACSCDADCPGSGTCAGTAGTARNACNDGACAEVSPGQGECANGPSDRYCDALTRADGRGLIRCLSNADCAADIVGADAGACALAETRPCFLEPIVVAGAPSPVAPFGAAVFCIPPTNSSAINEVTGLPGPGRLRLQSVLQLFCASDPTAPYLPGTGGCPAVAPPA